jgi:putative transposase
VSATSPGTCQNSMAPSPPRTASRVTDAVLEYIAALRTRPLAALYPIVYFDCLMVRVRGDRSVRARACISRSARLLEDVRDLLGL